MWSAKTNAGWPMTAGRKNASIRGIGVNHHCGSRELRRSAGCWVLFPGSKAIVGAVAQTQGTVASAVESLSSEINMTDENGNPTGEEVFNYQPKSFLVIGSLSEFAGHHGINREKLRSFELYRRNTSNPEIITFDELYERAKFIVHHNES